MEDLGIGYYKEIAMEEHFIIEPIYGLKKKKINFI